MSGRNQETAAKMSKAACIYNITKALIFVNMVLANYLQVEIDQVGTYLTDRATTKHYLMLFFTSRFSGGVHVASMCVSLPVVPLYTPSNLQSTGGEGTTFV